MIGSSNTVMLQVSDGSLYAALHKLEREGWITAGSKTANLGDTEILLAHASQPPAIGQRGQPNGSGYPALTKGRSRSARVLLDASASPGLKVLSSAGPR